MRITAKAMEFLGLFLLFAGGGSIGEYMLIPLATAFTGAALAFAGVSLDMSTEKRRE